MLFLSRSFDHISKKLSIIVVDRRKLYLLFQFQQQFFFVPLLLANLFALLLFLVLYNLFFNLLNNWFLRLGGSV